MLHIYQLADLEIKSRSVWFQGTQIHCQLFMLPEKRKCLESYLLLSGTCLEKMPDSHPMWFQTPACCSLNSGFTGCFLKRSQTHECVRQDGKQPSTLVNIYTLVGIELRLVGCQISKFSPALVSTDNHKMWFLPHKGKILYPFSSWYRKMVCFP